MNTELLSFIGGAMELVGIYLLGNKGKFGFICNILCNIIWIAFVLLSGSAHGLLLVCIPALFLNTRGYQKWSRKIKE